MAQLTKTLESLYQAHDRYEVLKDYFKIVAITLNNSSEIIHDETWKANEQEYLNTVKKYSKEELEVLVEAAGMLIIIIDDDIKKGIYQDWLGDLYMKSCTASKEKAQHFTPYSVGKLMADMNIKGDIEKLRTQDVITFNDPCVGGGCLPIAYCAALRENNINYQQKALVFAEDNDERCFYMTYIQLSLIGCPAKVELRDTLLMKNLGKTWYTPALKMQWLKFRKHLETDNRS